MLIQAQQANATLRRTALYRRVERHLQERFINYVPLLNTQQAYAFRRRLVGVEIDPLGQALGQAALANSDYENGLG